MTKTRNINSTIDDLFSRTTIVPRRAFLGMGAAISAATLFQASETHAVGVKTSKANSLPVTQEELDYMRQAIDLMRRAGVVDRTGGPFGAVIVRDGQILSAEGNSVLRDNDPTGHAEVNAIRAACKRLALHILLARPCSQAVNVAQCATQLRIGRKLIKFIMRHLGKIISNTLMMGRLTQICAIIRVKEKSV